MRVNGYCRCVRYVFGTCETLQKSLRLLGYAACRFTGYFSSMEYNLFRHFTPTHVAMLTSFNVIKIDERARGNDGPRDTIIGIHVDDDYDDEV